MYLVVVACLLSVFSLTKEDTTYCTYSNEYNITNELNNSVYKTINENNTHYNTYYDLIQYYPRTQHICSRGATLSTTQGISMQPFLYDGDSYYTEKVTFNDLELGDVIIFKNNNGKTIHSVIGLYNDSLVTAGYSNTYKDEIIDPKQVLERYCFKK